MSAEPPPLDSSTPTDEQIHRAASSRLTRELSREQRYERMLEDWGGDRCGYLCGRHDCRTFHRCMRPASHRTTAVKCLYQCWLDEITADHGRLVGAGDNLHKELTALERQLADARNEANRLRSVHGRAASEVARALRSETRELRARVMAALGLVPGDRTYEEVMAYPDPSGPPPGRAARPTDTIAGALTNLFRDGQVMVSESMARQVKGLLDDMGIPSAAPELLRKAAGADSPRETVAVLNSVKVIEIEKKPRCERHAPRFIASEPARLALAEKGEEALRCTLLPWHAGQHVLETGELWSSMCKCGRNRDRSGQCIVCCSHCGTERRQYQGKQRCFGCSPLEAAPDEVRCKSASSERCRWAVADNHPELHESTTGMGWPRCKCVCGRVLENPDGSRIERCTFCFCAECGAANTEGDAGRRCYRCKPVSRFELMDTDDAPKVRVVYKNGEPVGVEPIAPAPAPAADGEPAAPVPHAAQGALPL